MRRSPRSATARPIFKGDAKWVTVAAWDGPSSSMPRLTVRLFAPLPPLSFFSLDARRL